MAKFRLSIKQLAFVSPVDTPAQETARVLLTKRAGDAFSFSAFAPVVKLSETTDADGNAIGLVFCWAVTEKANGQDYFDLQGDQVLANDDLIRAALDYVKSGAKTDEMHDGNQDGFAPFVMPLTAEVAKAFGIDTKTTGLMVGLKPSADVFAKFKSGEYTGVSIEGIGQRTKVASGGSMQTKCEKCGSYMEKDADACPQCGEAAPKKRAPVGKRFQDKSGAYVETDDAVACVAIGKRAPVSYSADARADVLKATWSTADVDDFPDSSFLYIEGGGSKDASGKTTPRSLRHFPYKDENGKADLPHLRDAISRIPQSSLPATLRNKLQVKAEKLLAAQHSKDDAGKRAPGVRKAVLPTMATAGHAHLLSDNGEPDGYTDGACMPGADDGGWHQHPWLKSSDGTVVILEAEGHSHEAMSPADVDAVVESPRENDIDEDDAPQKRNRKSPHPSGARSVGPTKDESMTDLEKMTKRAERAEKIAELTDVQKTHLGTLSATDQDAFLAKSVADRDAEIAKRAESNAPIFKGELTGIEVRKSDGDLALKLAKQQEESAKALKTERDARAVSEAKTEHVELEKRAGAEIGFLKGATDDKVELLRRIHKGADVEQNKRLLEIVRSGDAAMKSLGMPAGANPGGPPSKDDVDGTLAMLKTKLGEFCKANNIPATQMWSLGLPAFEKTEEGAALSEAHSVAKSAARK